MLATYLPCSTAYLHRSILPEMLRRRLLLTRTSWRAPLDLMQPILGLFHKHPLQDAVALRTVQELIGSNTCRGWRLLVGAQSLQCKWSFTVGVIDELWKVRKLYLIEGFLICKMLANSTYPKYRDHEPWRTSSAALAGDSLGQEYRAGATSRGDILSIVA